MIINSSEPAKPPLPPTAVYQGCPYLGRADDPKTRLLFPADDAVCHHANPESEVDVAYQQTTCLTAAHEACVVFLRPQQGPLPPEISGLDGSRTRSHRIFLGILVILVFAVVGIWIGLWWVNSSSRTTALVPTTSPEDNNRIADAVPTSVTAVPTMLPTDSPIPPTNAASPTMTPTRVPTDTPVPVDTPSPTLPPTFTPRANTATPLAVAMPMPQAVVNVPRLNVRQGPGTAYDAIALIDEGEQFDITGRIQNGSWLQICCIANASGWVYAESVLIEGNLMAVPVVTNFLPTPTASP